MSRSIPISLLFVFSWMTAFTQDTILFENKWPYLANVKEIKADQIIFQKIKGTDSLLFTIEKRYITEIWYSNPDLGRQKIKNAPISLSKPLDIWITPPDTPGVFRGSLHSLNDSTLFLRKKDKVLEGTKGVPADVISSFPYHRIFEIKVRQRNKVRQYATYGAIGGFALGTLTGLMIYKDEPPCDPLSPDGRPCDGSLFSPRTKFDKSLLLGFGSGAAGFLVGGVVGSVRITIPIGSRFDLYEVAVPRLLRMSKSK